MVGSPQQIKSGPAQRQLPGPGTEEVTSMQDHRTDGASDPGRKKLPRLTEPQRHAIRVGSPRQWLGTREVGVSGDTMDALARKGLAEVRRAQKPYPRHIYRLTQEGNELRIEWRLVSLAEPVEHTPVRVRCTHCGTEFADGTPGGSCGACGLTVVEVQS